MKNNKEINKLVKACYFRMYNDEFIRKPFKNNFAGTATVQNKYNAELKLEMAKASSRLSETAIKWKVRGMSILGGLISMTVFYFLVKNQLWPVIRGLWQSYTRDENDWFKNIQ